MTGNGVVYVDSDGGDARVPSIGLDGVPRWESSITWRALGDVAAVGDLLVLLVQSADEGDTSGGVLALDRVDGDLVWAAPLDGAPLSRPHSLAVWGDLVIAPDYSGRVTALDTTSGDSAWTLGITGDPERPPRLFQDTLFVAARSSLLAIDAATGTVRWESDPPDRGGLIDAVIGTADGTVLAVAENAATMDDSDRFLVTAYATADGSPLWAIEVSEWATVAGDVLVTADRDPRREDGSPARPIDAWAASTGDPLWADDTRLLIRSMAWDTHHLYLAIPPTDRRPGALAALDPATGTAVWVSPVEGTVTAPPLATADPVIVPTSESRVVGRPTGSVTTLELTTGTQLWTHPFDQPVRGSPAAVDNVIIVLTADDPPRCF